MVKRNTYSLTGLSEDAVKTLPCVLDTAGYAGRYEIGTYGLSINSTRRKVCQMFQEAENIAHRERGHLVMVKEVSYKEVWIPESKASDVVSAYKKVFEMVSNEEISIDQDPELSVACPADSPIESEYSFKDEDLVGYMSKT